MANPNRRSPSGQQSPGGRGNRRSRRRGPGGASRPSSTQRQSAPGARPRSANAPAAPASPPPLAGPDATAAADTSVTFADLGVPPSITRELRAQGIEHPFPIQAAALPDGLAGRDVLGCGPTGSGKTFTFGIPMLAALIGNPSRPGRPRGLILAPTRELAQQISDRLDVLAASSGLRVLCVVGGVNVNRHRRALAMTVDLLVATPGRLLDLMQTKDVSLADVATVAIDEADIMADMGFIPQVRKILNAVPRSAQHQLFSATLDGDVGSLVKSYMSDPVQHATAPATDAVDRTEHFLLVVADKDERLDAAARLAHATAPAIFFMRTTYSTDRMVKQLGRKGVDSVSLHGRKTPAARTRAMDAFRAGTIPTLIATDIAARGIDVSDVDLVVHIDPPAEHKAFVHRAGRTARAGKYGTVVTLCFSDTQAEVEKMMAKANVYPTIVQGDAGVGTIIEHLGSEKGVSS